MKKDAAAFYCGYGSLSSFDRAMEAGEMPEGRTASGGVFWLRADLEAAMVGRKARKTDFGTGI
jgi:hypothetical protein